MRTIEELTANGDARELRARRRSLTAYRDVLARDEYCKDERLDVEYDIMLINNRLTELED